MIYEILDECVRQKSESYVPDEHDGYVSAADLLYWVNNTFPFGWSEKDAELENKRADEAAELIVARVREMYEKKVSGERPDYVDQMERSLMLQAIDKMWQRHINDMDALREGVRLRAQGQRDPLVEYKREAYGLFETLMQDIQFETVTRLFRSTTNLSAFEDFLASLPMGDSADDDGLNLLGNGDLLAALRGQLRQMHEREQQAAQISEDSQSGALPPGLAIREKKVNLPERKKRFVNIRPEKASTPGSSVGGASDTSDTPTYTPEDATPSL